MSAMVAALQAAFKHTREGFTVVELLELAKLPNTQLSKLKVRAFLRGEIAAGRVVGTFGRRIAIHGHSMSIPVYIPVVAKPPARKKK